MDSSGRLMFDAIAETYDDYVADHPGASSAPVRRFHELADVRSPVLDVGCGPGHDSLTLRQLQLGSGPIVNIDFSHQMAIRAAGRSSCPALQADVSQLPIRSGSAGTVWCNSLLMSISPAKVAAAITELGRVLAPSGALGLVTTDGDGRPWTVRRLDGNGPRTLWAHSWTKQSRMLDAAGIDVQHIGFSPVNKHVRWILAVGLKRVAAAC